MIELHSFYKKLFNFPRLVALVISNKHFIFYIVLRLIFFIALCYYFCFEVKLNLHSNILIDRDLKIKKSQIGKDDFDMES